MVDQTSSRHIQAVMNNPGSYETVKFIILDYLAAKKSGILERRRDFSDWSIIQSLSLEGNALQVSYRVQYTQG